MQHFINYFMSIQESLKYFSPDYHYQTQKSQVSHIKI